MTFKKFQCIGGHVSRAHPGMSEAYEKKMQFREARTPQRELLQKAQNLLLERDPALTSQFFHKNS